MIGIRDHPPDAIFKNQRSLCRRYSGGGMEMYMNQKHYKATIITPFHNVDLAMFENCRKSVLGQTIGFENIQWIIILHNCEDLYIREVPGYFEGLDNVVVKVLNNDAHTPSSPRNYAFQFATGDYIGYLDGDDSYTPKCLETAVCEIEAAKAQVLCFRREYELERPGLFALSETILWNQTYERIIVNRDNWDMEKMFSGVFGLGTSKIYDRQYLTDNHIIFDESIPFAEDLQFVVDSFVHADRIVYLPQMIGYHYYINSHSLVQNDDVDGETLIGYAKGLAKIFDNFLQYGIETDVVQSLSMKVAGGILASSRTTLEQRQEICAILSPYLMEATMWTPNKLRTAEYCHTMYYIPREVILNPENPYGGPHVSGLGDGSITLQKILRTNADSDYGRRYSFSTLKTAAAYRFHVPLCTGATLEPLVRLQTNIGEQQVLTSGRNEYYIKQESGSLLPFTNDHLKQYESALIETLTNKRSLLIGQTDNNFKIANDSGLITGLESLLMNNVLNRINIHHEEYHTHLGSNPGYYYTFNDDELYIRLLRDALLDLDLEQIVALNTERIEEVFYTLENKQEMVLEFLARRSPERAKEVSAILAEGFDKPIIHKLWPKLERVIAYGAGEKRESARRLKRYIADVPHNHGYVYSETALLGKAIADNSDLFEMSLNDNYYELLPLNATENTPTITPDQAQPDTPYQLIVTTQAGLYRYVTDHFIYVRSKNFGRIQYTIY